MTFPATLFGQELAKALNVLAALQAEESRRFNRVERHPLMAIFTSPVGTSWFEADMLTRHFYANRGSLECLLADDCVPGAREAFEWREGEGAGLTMLQVRQMLLSRFVEVASSLQAGIVSAQASINQHQTQPEPVTRWPQRQHAGLYGVMVRQGEPPGYRTEWSMLHEFNDNFPEPFPEVGHGQNLRVRRVRTNRTSIHGLTPNDGRWPRPGWEGNASPVAEAAARGTGSREESPAPQSPEEEPVSAPRREPRWLLPRADSVPPTTPGSEEATREPLEKLEPPTLTDAGWFAEPGPSEH